MTRVHPAQVRLRVPLAVVLWALALAHARAGTIEVLVRERGGDTIRGQEIRLVPHPEPGLSPLSFRYPYATTDEKGTARLVDIEPGTYTFRFGQPPLFDLLRPEDNPYGDVPVVTLPRADSTVAIAVELWRGVPIVLDVRSIDAPFPTGRLVLTHVETGRGFEVGFSIQDGDRKHVERAVVEGRWRVAIDLPYGYLIRDLRANGESLPGAFAEVDTAVDPRTQYVSWELSAPCLVGGRLIPSGDALPRDRTVVATPVEPGPWVATEAARGRVHARVEPQEWMPDARFNLRLPEGLWRITPEGTNLEASDPPYVELRLVPGSVANQNFTLTAPDEAGGSGKLQVEVVDPQEGGVGDAFVAVYAAGNVGLGDAVRTGRTTNDGFRVGTVIFEGLPKGAYEIVAGHRDWLDGHRAVEVDPEENEGRATARVMLGRPASLRVFAFEAEGAKPVPQVEVTVDWLAEDYPSVLTDARLDAERRHRAQRTDTTGYVTFRGLVNGSYRVAARVTGERQETRYAKLRAGGPEERDALDLGVVVPQEHEVEVLIHTGASIVGTIACDDDGPVPPSATFRAYLAADAWGDNELGPGGLDAGEPDAAPPEGEPAPVLRLVEKSLGGPHLDAFVVGPFEAGAYVLAFKPKSYHAWSWVYGTDLREEAAVLHLVPGRAADVGAVEASCGPAVLLRPSIESGDRAPDMSQGTYVVTATRRLDTGEVAPVTPVLEARRSHVLVRGLEEGATDLRVEIRHPHLIPPRLEHEVRALALERGVRAVENLRVQAVGGALTVRTTSPAVRLRDDRGSVATPALGGIAALEGVPAGTYLLEACADAACARTKGDPVSVRVEAQRTRELRLEPRP